VSLADLNGVSPRFDTWNFGDAEAGNAQNQSDFWNRAGFGDFGRDDSVTSSPDSKDKLMRIYGNDADIFAAVF
jgi:hypothetical protein